MSRPLAVVACCALLAAPAAGAATLGGGSFGKAGVHTSAPPPKSWAQPEIRVVVAHGLMAKSVAKFRANDTLTQGELAALVAELTKQPLQTPADPTAPVTLTKLDARLVSAIGLSDAAAGFVAGAHADGLTIPARFGTETVARLLGLRTTTRPSRTIWSCSRRRRPRARRPPTPSPRSSGSRAGSSSTSRTPSRPSRSPADAWQLRVLNTAVRFIGYPYVWGGTSEHAESPFGVKARAASTARASSGASTSCQKYPGGAALNATIQGRTTYQMSGEVPRSKRIGFAKLAPGDVVFFGSRGPKSTPGAGRAHRHLPRQRLDDPLLGPGRRSGADDRLVPAVVRLGAPAAGRSRLSGS